MRVKNLFFLPVLIIGLGLILTGSVMAQTFTTLHTFSAIPNFSSYSNSDGANPYAGLILSSNVLYGTTEFGGTNGYGALFAVQTDGSSFTNLHSFASGSVPQAGLILSSNILYGTTYGNFGDGAVFKVNTDGSSFTNVYNFTGSDGVMSQAGLVLSGNTLFGTAAGGGSFGDGIVFRINTDGSGYTNLYDFTGGSDGGIPQAGLILSGNTLFGTTVGGVPTSGYGTVFSINTDGSSFTNLHSFTALSGGNFTNTDGEHPQAGLILSGNTLYGTARTGGSGGNGTVFSEKTDGSGFTTLYNFTALSGLFPSTNNDGANPYAGLILSGNTLYGATSKGGTGNSGTVFAINTDGTSFTNLHNFTAIYGSTNSDGAYPYAALILSGNTLYGTTKNGGSSGNGTVFSLSLPVSAPQLTIIPFGANVILMWPTNASGFTLQSTTNIVPPAVWNTNFPSPVVVNGQNTLTNPVSGTQQFYRLLHP